MDVATGSGAFIETLALHLGSYRAIVGIDRSPRALAAAAAAAGREDVAFARMDAETLAFAPGSFDTVCISNSLHHLPAPAAVLREMLRLLRPGGRLLVSEMYCDGQTETQMTHVYLHHWWAAVDTACGLAHFSTYRRAELAALVGALDLAGLALYDDADLHSDPRDPTLRAELEETIDRCLARLGNWEGETPGSEGEARRAQGETLRQEGEALRRRLRGVGLHWAARLVAVGTRRHADVER